MATIQEQLQELASDLADVQRRAVRIATGGHYELIGQMSLSALTSAVAALSREAKAQPEAAITTSSAQMSERTWRAGHLFRFDATPVQLMGPDNSDQGDADIATLAQLAHDATACALKAQDLVQAHILTSNTSALVQHAAHALERDLEACKASNNRAD